MSAGSMSLSLSFLIESGTYFMNKDFLFRPESFFWLLTFEDYTSESTFREWETIYESLVFLNIFEKLIIGSSF